MRVNRGIDPPKLSYRLPGLSNVFSPASGLMPYPPSAIRLLTLIPVSSILKIYYFEPMNLIIDGLLKQQRRYPYETNVSTE
jgi:hypothetical protein